MPATTPESVEILPNDIASVREKVVAHFDANPDQCFPEDIERIKGEEYQVKRFLLVAKDVSKHDEIVTSIVNTLKWRKDNNVTHLKKEDFPIEYYQCGGIFTYGKDKTGGTLLILRVKANKRIPEWADLLKKFILFLFEKLDAENGVDGKGITVVFDCNGAGISNVDTDLLSFIVSCLRDFYPLLLNQVLVHELPFILMWVFKLVQSWMPQESQKMIKLISKKEVKDYIAEDEMPDFMGGTNSLSYKDVPKGVFTAEEIAEKMNINKKACEKLMKHLEPFITKS